MPVGNCRVAQSCSMRPILRRVTCSSLCYMQTRDLSELEGICKSEVAFKAKQNFVEKF